MRTLVSMIIEIDHPLVYCWSTVVQETEAQVLNLHNELKKIRCKIIHGWYLETKNSPWNVFLRRLAL